MTRALLLLLLPLLAGCFGGTGPPLPADRRALLREQLEALDRLSGSELEGRQAQIQAEIKQAGKPEDRHERERLAARQFLLAYCWERRGDFSEARRSYERVRGSSYESVALVRTAQIAEYSASQEAARAEDASLSAVERQEAAQILKLRTKEARGALEHAANRFQVGTLVLLRDPPVATLQPGAWGIGDLRHEAYRRLDKYYREKTSYRVFDYLVRLCGGPDSNSSYLLTILLIAVLAKLVTTPLSGAQFRSMRAIQAVQPELKKLQQKYKDDKQQLARAQMELFKAHKINPASSCLPMLIQFPILIWVYWGIRSFVYRFEGVHFLYIKSLADPDLMRIGEMLWPGPLLLFYGVSMYFSQKLISTPAATPEQQQQQKLMVYLMPVLFVFILKSLPAAFILYWLLQNILMTGHQYFIMRSYRQAQAGPGDKTSVPPPAEAIAKLSQGPKPAKKKKGRGRKGRA